MHRQGWGSSSVRVESYGIDAIILAGGVNPIPLDEGCTPGNKAIVEFAGTPSIRYVHDALAHSRFVREVCIVGPRDELEGVLPGDRLSYVPAADNLLGSLLAGLSFFGDRPLVLTVSADLPLLTGPILDTFVTSCAAAGAMAQDNVFIAVAPGEAFRNEFSRTTKMMSRFRDGTFCHGNVLLVQPSVLQNVAAMDRINAMYAARKSPIKSALALGLTVGLAYVVGVHFLHLLTLRQMASLASKHFRLGIVPVPIPHPEVAIDFDEAEDYRLIVDRLSRGPGR